MLHRSTHVSAALLLAASHSWTVAAHPQQELSRSISRRADNGSDALYKHVDPFIGTVGATPGSAVAGGNSFPGASLPWAAAKPGIDTSYLGLPNGTSVDCNAGFSPIGNVTGISMTHVSGTGGVPSCTYI